MDVFSDPSPFLPPPNLSFTFPLCFLALLFYAIENMNILTIFLIFLFVCFCNGALDPDQIEALEELRAVLNEQVQLEKGMEELREEMKRGCNMEEIHRY